MARQTVFGVTQTRGDVVCSVVNGKQGPALGAEVTRDPSSDRFRIQSGRNDQRYCRRRGTQVFVVELCAGDRPRKSVALPERRGQPQRLAAIRPGKFVAVSRCAAPEVAQVDAARPSNSWHWLARDHIERTATRVASKQGSLRPAQQFHPLRGPASRGWRQRCDPGTPRPGTRPPPGRRSARCSASTDLAC